MTRLADTLIGQLKGHSPAHLPAWTADLRSRAASDFKRNGLPNIRLEAWKYTSLRKLENEITGLGRAAVVNELPGTTLDVAQDVRVVMTDGAFTGTDGRGLAGLEIQSLEDALEEANNPLAEMLESLDTGHASLAFSALNNATLGQGVVIRVRKGVDAGRLLVQWNSSGMADTSLFNSRVCLLIDAGASLELVEEFSRRTGAAAALNVVRQVRLGKGAALQHTQIQQDDEQATLITRTEIEQAETSRYEFTGLDLGGGLVRHDLRSQLRGAGAHCELRGAYLPRGRSHVDVHLEIEHQAPNCSSGQFYRGVLDDRGRAVWNGRVHVHPGADGTEARQSNANLLLSRQAEVDTKPELEIEADEVIASHGATVGQLDEDAIFYLRSRGLDETTARQLLTGAFCRAVTDKLPAGPVREALGGALDSALGNKA